MHSDLKAFLENCVTPFHFGQQVRKRLTGAHYAELREDVEEDWISPPQKGFVIRDQRALIAYNCTKMDSAVIVGTHCDSPALKTKPNFDTPDNTVNVAPYGGGQWASWYDRELRIAGRVLFRKGEEIKSELIDSKEPIAIIPSPPTQLSQEFVQTADINTQTHLVPIIGVPGCPTIKEWIAQQLQIEVGDIVDADLFFQDAQKPEFIGARREFIASQRIDNLLSTFTGLTAFLQSNPIEHMNVFVVFDNEEIGSCTRLGARCDFLDTFFRRMIKDDGERARFLARSYIISSDNSHAINPNYTKLYEDNHAPKMSKGTVIKRSPSSAYATDSASTVPLRQAANATKTKLQSLIMRNDIRGGMTLGPLISTNLGISTVDIGMPQLAMHSTRELASLKDVEDQIRLLATIFDNYKSS